MASDNAEFLREQQRAVERMREMHQKSGVYPLPRQPAAKAPENPQPTGRSGGLIPPLPERLKKDPDMALIGGLLLLLWSENADRKLLLALLYILL